MRSERRNPFPADFDRRLTQQTFRKRTGAVTVTLTQADSVVARLR
jgi:hypothetical protein